MVLTFQTVWPVIAQNLEFRPRAGNVTDDGLSATAV